MNGPRWIVEWSKRNYTGVKMERKKRKERMEGNDGVEAK
jgi:hypothetical protein